MDQPQDPVSPVQGQLFIVSAPSGAGKTTLCREILKRFPRMRYSVSHTTRAPRQGEIPGKDYHFISDDTFESGIAEHLWAEWARVHGHYYGTSARFLVEACKKGIDVLLDIDVQGMRQMIRRFPDSITVFVMPPSPEVLSRRLLDRGTESPEAIERRMSAAHQEMAQCGIYRYTVVNDDLDTAVAKLADIVRCHSPRA